MPIHASPKVLVRESAGVAGGDEALLTSRALAGDGAAFAELYERYEQRVYNLCLRLLDSPHDAADATQEAFVSVLGRLPKLAGRELQFGSYVFSAARNASYDMLARRGRQRPTEDIAAAADGVMRPGDGRVSPHDDPSRSVLLGAQQEEIRAANARLPARQREVLALRELAGLSYDEIGAIMELNRNAVAQLVSRARLGLRAELRHAAAASIAPAGPDCERALPLMAQRADGQLRSAGDEVWLDAHIDGCEGCRLGREAMAEAGASYRAWVPLAAAPWLFRETLAEAATIAGEDWSEVIERGRPSERRASSSLQAPVRSMPEAPGPPDASPAPDTLVPGQHARRRRRWRQAGGVAAALAALVLVAVLAQDVGDATPTPTRLMAKAAHGSPAQAAAPATPSQRGPRPATPKSPAAAAADTATPGATATERAASGARPGTSTLARGRTRGSRTGTTKSTGERVAGGGLATGTTAPAPPPAVVGAPPPPPAAAAGPPLATPTPPPSPDGARVRTPPPPPPPVGTAIRTPPAPPATTPPPPPITSRPPPPPPPPAPRCTSPTGAPITCPPRP